MDLKTYLELNGIRHKDFAAKIGVTPVSICNYLGYRRKPSASVIQKIEIETKGKVTVHDLVAYWEANKKYG